VETILIRKIYRLVLQAYENHILFSIRVPKGSSTTADALAIGSVAVELKQIPNQPIIFSVKTEDL